jgi:hypothetical protein
MHPPIDFGNGYGYFCDLDKPKKIYTYKRFYIEDIEHDIYSTRETYNINIYTNTIPMSKKTKNNPNIILTPQSTPAPEEPVYRELDCELTDIKYKNKECKTGINIIQMYGIFITTMLIYTLFIT